MNRQFAQIKEMMTAFSQPTLEIPTIPTEDRVKLRWELIYEENKELVDDATAGNIVKVADALTDLSVVLIGAYFEYGMAHLYEPLFNEVHRSNMSKLCKTQEEAETTCKVRSHEFGVPTHWAKVGEFYAVYNSNTGKFLKSINFSEPDLASILEKDGLRRGL